MSLGGLLFCEGGGGGVDLKESGDGRKRHWGGEGRKTLVVM